MLVQLTQFLSKYSVTDDICVLAEVTLVIKTMTEFKSNEERQLGMLFSLGDVYLTIYWKTNDLSCLLDAIECFEQVIGNFTAVFSNSDVHHRQPGLSILFL